MKLLFDQHLSFKLCARLKDIFPQTSQVRLLGLDRAEDDEIWQYAYQNGFTIVTKDADSSDLSILRGAPPQSYLVALWQPTNGDHRKYHSNPPHRDSSIWAG